jgi:uncharacterized protein (DUF1501 family)
MAHTRREFLKRSTCALGTAALLSGFKRFGLASAYAQSEATATDYKALVCVFLLGGNDGNNTVIPLDSTGYSNYTSARQTLAFSQAQLALTTLSRIPPSIGTPFALHPSLVNLTSLFNNKKAAVLCNTGTLVQAITLQQYKNSSVPIPFSLFSHIDQQSQWQTSRSDSVSTTGWGGRTADDTEGLNPPGTVFPMIASMSGANLFSTGAHTSPVVVTPGKPLQLNGTGSANNPSARYTALQNLLSVDRDTSLVNNGSGVMQQAIADGNLLTAALAGAPKLTTVFPNTDLGGQLLQIAQIMSVRATLGLQRQIFFCALGGFDTHSDQLNTQAALLTEVDHALMAFYNSTLELGISTQVTTFTLSDFSRTLQPSSNVGTDHAWGNHHFIIGDSVKGGDFYGAPHLLGQGSPFPVLVLGGPNDVGGRGRWLPTSSVDQYGATLAAWYGVQSGDIPTVFPNIRGFNGITDLGFMN